ncbi:hypothetical protein F5Y10DRAFT_258137 [Nemania abortiva]|nr:hypothetical protein F5Y10DRAFT_258137 [Nemania abortiva]
MWYYIQMEIFGTSDVSSSDDRKATTLEPQQANTMSFATPVRYVAFFGLDLVIEKSSL